MGVKITIQKNGMNTMGCGEGQGNATYVRSRIFSLSCNSVCSFPALQSNEARWPCLPPMARCLHHIHRSHPVNLIDHATHLPFLVYLTTYGPPSKFHSFRWVPASIPTLATISSWETLQVLSISPSTSISPASAPVISSSL